MVEGVYKESGCIARKHSPKSADRVRVPDLNDMMRGLRPATCGPIVGKRSLQTFSINLSKQSKERCVVGVVGGHPQAEASLVLI